MKLQYGTGPTIRGYRPEEDYTYNVEQTPLATSGGPGTQQIKDVLWNVTNAPSSDNNFRVTLNRSPLDPNASLINRSPTVCALDGSGNVVRTADGMAMIEVSSILGHRLIQQQLVRSAAAQVLNSVNSLATGSLLKYLTDQRNAILAASSGDALNPTRRRAFVNADGSGGSNASQMLRRTGVTGFTALNLDPVEFNAYRWITPKHRIFTYHTSPYWTVAEGGTATSTPGVVRDAGSTMFGTKIGADTGIVYEKNTTIATANQCKLLPSNWRSYLPTSGSSKVDVPCWSRRYWAGDTANPEHYWHQAASLVGSSALAPVDSTALTFAHPTNGTMGWGGDSGSPVFMGINGYAVLVSHLSWSGGSWSDNYADMLSTINAALVATATAGGDVSPNSYAVQTADLSGFTAF